MRRALLAIALLCECPAAALAQAGAQASREIDPRDAADRRVNLAEPDFTTINLPTTLRLPRFKSSFRISHRFARTLTRGSFGELVEDFFGLDNGAAIGLEYRFGLMRGLQAGIYRTSDKTIQFFGQYDVARQGTSLPLTINAVASIEGVNNFHRGDVVDHHDSVYATGIGMLLSRTIGGRAAVYIQPSYVIDANTYSNEGCLEHLEHGHDIPGCADVLTTGIDSDTILVGLTSRVRISERVYLVASWTPRASGFSPGTSIKSFGIEKRLGGHLFQLNLSNSLGTTVAQTARGASNNSDWFLGFNISRKFF